MTSEEIRNGPRRTLGEWLREIAAMQAEILMELMLLREELRK